MNKLMFCDGTNSYNEINKIYKTHKKGYVILGPPGIGKSTFINDQHDNNWIDMDYLLTNLGVDWKYNELNESNIKINYLKVDYILEQSKLLGYRIVGSPFWNYKADAIVVIPLETHIKYTSKRSDLDITNIDNIRNIFIKHSEEYNIPLFNSINNAITYLESLD